MSSGTPSRILGNGSLLTVTCVVLGLIDKAARTTTLPKSNGPASAGVTITKLNGAPSYGPAKYTWPATYSGAPEPVPTCTTPTSEPAGHDGCASSNAPYLHDCAPEPLQYLPA